MGNMYCCAEDKRGYKNPSGLEEDEESQRHVIINNVQKDINISSSNESSE